MLLVQDVSKINLLFPCQLLNVCYQKLTPVEGIKFHKQHFNLWLGKCFIVKTQSSSTAQKKGSMCSCWWIFWNNYNAFIRSETLISCSNFTLFERWCFYENEAFVWNRRRLIRFCCETQSQIGNATVIRRDVSLQWSKQD